MSPSKHLAAATLALLAATVTFAGDARAQSCGMGDIDWYATERANVARAGELLQHGDPRAAAWILQRTWPRLREAVPVPSSLEVIAEGVRLMALASVRADGHVRLGLGWSSWTPFERALNVAWGVRRLRMLAANEPSSDVAKTDLGEALSRSPDTRGEARAILESLDASRAIASPEGYAALALVRNEIGDVAGAARASAECAHDATDIAAQCGSMVVHVAPTVTAAR